MNPFSVMTISKKYIVYVIRSRIKDYQYAGMTSDLTRRLNDHNLGYNKSTKPYAPFDLIYTEVCIDSISARKREKFLKSTRGRIFLKEQLG